MPPNEPEPAATDISTDQPAEITRPAEITQAAAVREAMNAGHDRPGPGVDWIRERYGLEVDRSAFSAVRSKEIKRLAAGTDRDGTRRPGRPLSMPPSSASSGPPGTPAYAPLLPSLELHPTPPGGEHPPARRPLVVPPPRTVSAPTTPQPPPPPSQEAPAGSNPTESRRANPADHSPVPAISWRELLDDLREIQRLKLRYGSELAKMVDEV